jgi:hypothetical protein
VIGIAGLSVGTLSGALDRRRSTLGSGQDLGIRLY